MIGTRHPDSDVPAALMALAGGHGRLLWHKSKDWASTTFKGSRDEVAFEFMGDGAVEAGDRMLMAMHSAEFVLFDRTVADIELTYSTRLMRPMRRMIAVIELLLVAD